MDHLTDDCGHRPTNTDYMPPLPVNRDPFGTVYGVARVADIKMPRRLEEMATDE